MWKDYQIVQIVNCDLMWKPFFIRFFMFFHANSHGTNSVVFFTTWSIIVIIILSITGLKNIFVTRMIALFWGWQVPRSAFFCLFPAAAIFSFSKKYFLFCFQCEVCVLMVSHSLGGASARLCRCGITDCARVGKKPRPTSLGKAKVNQGIFWSCCYKKMSREFKLFDENVHHSHQISKTIKN